MATGENSGDDAGGYTLDVDGNTIYKGDTLVGIENLKGSDHDDTLTGNDAVNIIDGGDGDDRLYGGDGIDTLYGEDGVDRLYGGNSVTCRHAHGWCGQRLPLRGEGRGHA